MLRHIVLLRWATTVAPVNSAALLADLQDLVRSMRGALAVDAVVGLGLADETYDAVLIADFVDESAWHAYQSDVRHVSFVAERLRPVLEERATIQVELPDSGMTPIRE